MTFTIFFKDNTQHEMEMSEMTSIEHTTDYVAIYFKEEIKVPRISGFMRHQDKHRLLISRKNILHTEVKIGPTLVFNSGTDTFKFNDK